MRVRTAIIADDLSGANATGALLSARGLQTLSVLDHAGVAALLDGWDALTIDADTRALSPTAAYARVRMLAAQMDASGVPLVGKRIDSTLRGNVGAEIDALLDGVSTPALALVVAAVPAAGRVTAGGYLLLNGVPLLETSAGADPWSPPASSRVAAVIAVQSRHGVGALGLGDLEAGPSVSERLCNFVESGVRIVVADATTNAHLNLLAAAAEDLPVLPVDPGPFSAALAWRRFGSRLEAPPVLAVAGSVTRQTQEQLTELAALPGVTLVAIDAAALLDEAAAGEIERASRALICAGDSSLLILSSVHTREAVLDLGSWGGRDRPPPEAAARLIASGLAKTVRRSLDAGLRMAGLYATGGAVTQALAHGLGATGLQIEREILPLAVLGRLRGGPYAGLSVVSKGGLVGDHQAAVRCVEALRHCGVSPDS